MRRCWLHLLLHLLLLHLHPCLPPPGAQEHICGLPWPGSPGWASLRDGSPQLCTRACVPLISCAALEPGTWGSISKAQKSNMLVVCRHFFKPVSWRKVLQCWESFPPRSFAPGEAEDTKNLWIWHKGADFTLKVFIPHLQWQGWGGSVLWN